jgi:hypothetical protein
MPPSSNPTELISEAFGVQSQAILVAGAARAIGSGVATVLRSMPDDG